jgi:gamma-glutamyltranspeptidase/glutathione hydrolase
VAARAVLSGQSLEDSQTSPRWTVDEFGPFSEASLQIEPGLPESTLSDLSARGHAIEVLPGPQSGWGPVSIIEVDGDRRDTFADPRVDTTSAVIF